MDGKFNKRLRVDLQFNESLAESYLITTKAQYIHTSAIRPEHFIFTWIPGILKKKHKILYAWPIKWFLQGRLTVWNIAIFLRNNGYYGAGCKVITAVDENEILTEKS